MSDPTGTANILRQFTAYDQLREDYSPEVANALTQKSLARHNVHVTTDEVGAWHRLNTAAVNSQMDILAERQTADSLAAAAVAAILETASTPPTTHAPEVVSVEEDSDQDEVEDDEDELPSLGDIYGYENDEDNEEAALDDVLKAQERTD